MSKRITKQRRRRDDGIEAAIAATSGQTIIGLARSLGISHPSVMKWRRIPAERVPQVAALTGVPKHILRPDLHDPPHGER